MNGNTNCPSSDEGDSDLDMDIDALARIPCRQSSSNNVPSSTPVPIPISLDVDDNDVPPPNPQVDNNGVPYGLRKRRARISYKGMAQDSEDDEITESPSSSSHPKIPRLQQSRNVLDVSALLIRNSDSMKKLQKYTKNPQLLENLSKWRITMEEIQHNHLQDHNHFSVLEEFANKCGSNVDQLTLTCDTSAIKPPPYWAKLLELLTLIFKSAKFLKKFSVKYHKEGRENREQIAQVLQTIKQSGQTSLNTLHIFPLVCGSTASSAMNDKELKLLLELGEDGRISWTDIELGDGLLVEENFEVVNSLQKLLEISQNTLRSLVIHGGLKCGPNVSEDKIKQKITFPKKMEKLKEITICPKYNFVSEMLEHRNPASKRWREVRLDDESHGENEDADLKPMKLILALGQSDFPVLEKVVLGNSVELDEFGYRFIRNLSIFRCGSRWDLALRFPKTENKKGTSELRECQLPDGLKDPLFVQEVGTFFPFLAKVWIYLPSVSVLRTFFKVYENSKDLEELCLKTQFDFETTMESCLLPQLPSGEYGLSPSSKTVLATLREYKHFEDYIRYHNVELPLEDDEDRLEKERRTGAGIRALKSLKVLDIEHIPRKLFIPNPEDERRWYDHNFKYLTTTFGFESYPFSRRCHQEIVAMNLREYHWTGFNFLDPAMRGCGRSGYVAMDEIELSSSDDDLFTCHSRQKPRRGWVQPNSYRRAPSKGVQVAIQPSMLIPNDFNKNKANRDRE